MRRAVRAAPTRTKRARRRRPRTLPAARRGQLRGRAARAARSTHRRAPGDARRGGELARCTLLAPRELEAAIAARDVAAIASLYRPADVERSATHALVVLTGCTDASETGTVVLAGSARHLDLEVARGAEPPRVRLLAANGIRLEFGPGQTPGLELRQVQPGRWRVEGLPERGELELSGYAGDGTRTRRELSLETLDAGPLPWPADEPRGAAGPLD